MCAFALEMNSAIDNQLTEKFLYEIYHSLKRGTSFNTNATKLQPFYK